MARNHRTRLEFSYSRGRTARPFREMTTGGERERPLSSRRRCRFNKGRETEEVGGPSTGKRENLPRREDTIGSAYRVITLSARQVKKKKARQPHRTEKTTALGGRRGGGSRSKHAGREELVACVSEGSLVKGKDLAHGREFEEVEVP